MTEKVKDLHMRALRGGLVCGLIAALIAGPVQARVGSRPVLGSASGTAVGGPDAQDGDTVVITGGGWGHGIGMSQYGAYGRALNGSSATKILETYYSSSTVTTQAMPAKIRVGLLQGRQQITASSVGGPAAFKVAGSSELIEEGKAGTDWRVEVGGAGGMRLFKNGQKVHKDGVSVFGDKAHPLVMVFAKFGSLASIGGKAHDYAYGRLEFGTYSGSCSSDSCMRLVLSLPMQRYLYGLGEVPASWPDAALRAQAIAARTFAFSKVERLGQHLTPCDCAVYDSTVDQAYIGDTKRTGSGAYWDDWKSAVNGTKAQVILYKGDPIQALYSSSSGGHTENNENVWGGTPIPYLRGVPDAADDVSANPNHSWSVEFTWGQLSDKLNAAYGTGKLERLRLLKPFGVSGRVTVVVTTTSGGVKIVGNNKTVRVDGWDLRNALDLKDTLFRVKILTGS